MKCLGSGKRCILKNMIREKIIVGYLLAWMMRNGMRLIF